MYITELEITNLRVFAEAKVKLRYPGDGVEGDGSLPNVTLVLGNNGAGKTTVLRAVALAALAPIIATSGYVPYSMVRRPVSREAPCFVLGRFSDDSFREGHGVDTICYVSPIGVNSFLDRFAKPDSATPEHGFKMLDSEGDYVRMLDAFDQEQNGYFFVAGYGSARRVESANAFALDTQARQRHLRYLRVASLFEEGVVLRPLSSWLPTWENKGRRKQFINLLNRVLPPGARVLEEPVEGEYLFELNGAAVPFAALSDGYRAFIGWVADLLYHVAMNAPKGAKLVDTTGIVLVDEVDLHLHPEWQRTVIPTVARALPKLQFIFTSHSPLVAGTLRPSNVLLLETDAKGARLEPATEALYGLSADQILTSEYFGLPSTRAPEFTEKLRDTAKAARDGDADEAEHLLRMLTLGGEAANEAPPKRPAPKKPGKGAKPAAPRAKKKRAAKAPAKRSRA